MAEDPAEVLLEVLFHHLLQQLKQPGLVLGVHQTIIVHTIDLRGEREGEREGEERRKKGKGKRGTRGEKEERREEERGRKGEGQEG